MLLNRTGPPALVEFKIMKGKKGVRAISIFLAKERIMMMMTLKAACWYSRS
jgi:hypothetical protein